jgi:ribosomal protein S18 acetylase RimI-like enzyme
VNVVIKHCDWSEIQIIKPLWEGLRDYHALLSEQAAAGTFDKRVHQLKEKSRNGKIHILIVLDEDEEKAVGYCICSISETNDGEIDSLFIMERYRGQSIGDSLMNMTKEWFAANGTDNVSIKVQYENEIVLRFYSKHGFLPKTFILKNR